MIRYLFYFLFAVFLSFFETSFLSSVFVGLGMIPFVFVICVYLIQHHSFKTAIFWMVFHGFLLDSIKGSVIPYETFCYFFSAMFAITIAQRFFSQRSYYGVLACTASSYFVFLFLIFSELFIQWIILHRPMDSISFFNDMKFGLIFGFIFLSILFALAKRIRIIIQKLFLFSAS